MMNNMDPQRDVDPYNLCRRRRPLGPMLSEWRAAHRLTERQAEISAIVIVLGLCVVFVFWANWYGMDRVAGQ